MLTGIFQWIKSIFVGETAGILTNLLFKNASKALAMEIFNKENQMKAYEFVKELQNNKDMTNSQKAVEFNKKMAEWALNCGKVLAGSVVNCLREMAVNALKDETN